MVLMQNPRLLLLDEPVAGMTEAEIGKTVAILNNLKRTNTLLVVEHDMAFVREIAGRRHGDAYGQPAGTGTDQRDRGQ